MERADWKIVEILPPPYSKCAISGFTDGPFVDFGVRMSAIDPNVGVNIDVLKEAARFVGMVSFDEHRAQVARNTDLEATVTRLQEQVDELEEFKQAVDTIVSHDYAARKKPGRKVAA